MTHIALAVAAGGWAAAARAVPCSESIDTTAFPYPGYRLVLGAAGLPRPGRPPASR